MRPLSFGREWRRCKCNAGEWAEVASALLVDLDLMDLPRWNDLKSERDSAAELNQATVEPIGSGITKNGNRKNRPAKTKPFSWPRELVECELLEGKQCAS